MACSRCPGPRRAWWTTTLAAVAAVVGVLTFDLPGARAGDVETRTFAVQVDGKKAGEYTLNVQRESDGTLTVTGRSEVRVTVLLIPVYTYSYNAREVWKGGRLQHFASSGKEKGKEFNIRADLQGPTIHVVANGESRRVRPEVWTTSIWQLPESRLRNGVVWFLGCDTGLEFEGRCQFVGKEKLTAAGQEMSCTHYRVVKDVVHDVWYDAQERMVRDEWTSNGHRTVLELTDLSR
jgi:hypothetical protein